MTGTEVGEFFHRGDELMSDPPAKLTAAGRRYLQAIWEMAGSDAIDICEIETENRRTLAKVREHLILGGYLDITVLVDLNNNDGTWNIVEVALSERGLKRVSSC